MKRIYPILLLTLLAGPLSPGAFGMSWLKADGARIVNEEGRPVTLEGVNLGGWLVPEMWMMPLSRVIRAIRPQFRPQLNQADF